MDILRQAPIGSLARILSGNRILGYEEQRDDYEHPGRHIEVEDEQAASNNSNSTLVNESSSEQRDGAKPKEGGKPADASDPEKGAKPAKPTKTVHDEHYVHWRGDNDPDCPTNWTTGKKLYVTVILGLYTAVVCTTAADRRSS